jgi:hypothetical protein
MQATFPLESKLFSTLIQFTANYNCKGKKTQSKQTNLAMEADNDNSTGTK